MSFSFLHISDLHFGDEEASKQVFRDKAKEKIAKNQLTADCLIISGDIFNRGKLDTDGIQACKDFLFGIPGNEHTIVVPGNHDLDRSAQKKKSDESYNDFLTRKQLVFDKGKRALQGGFQLSEDDNQILCIEAYKDFIAFSEHMHFEGFNQAIADRTGFVFKKNEVQEIEPQLQISDFPFPIRFVLLNTGLIAGQSVRGKDYLNEKRELEAIYDEAMNEGKLVQAAKTQVEIAKLEEQFIKDGELIVDEKGSEEYGPGRLSLSKEANLRLSRIQSDNTVLTIFIGHHGYKFLSSETKTALKQAMTRRKSGIYLCGHAHQAGYNLIQIGNNTVPTHISQIQAGAMFKGDENFVQYGFNHGVFRQKTDNTIEGRITSFFLIKSASGDLRWMSEVMPILLTGIKPPPTNGESGKTNLIEVEKNLIDPVEKKPVSGPVSINNIRNNLFNKLNTEREGNKS